MLAELSPIAREYKAKPLDDDPSTSPHKTIDMRSLLQTVNQKES